MPISVDPRPADQDFIRFAIDTGVLKFGSFTTKAGRSSPYFFNAGLFDHGGTLGHLAEFYAKTFLAAEFDGRISADSLFGPAYKGITLASATAVALAKAGRDIGFSYNRKEAKDHGEGGVVVGKKLEGRVLIIDDVISAGTSVRESVEIIRAHGATGRCADRPGSDGARWHCPGAHGALGGARGSGSVRHSRNCDCHAHRSVAVSSGQS